MGRKYYFKKNSLTAPPQFFYFLKIHIISITDSFFLFFHRISISHFWSHPWLFASVVINLFATRPLYIIHNTANIWPVINVINKEKQDTWVYHRNHWIFITKKYEQFLQKYFCLLLCFEALRINIIVFFLIIKMAFYMDLGLFDFTLKNQ